MWAKLFEEVILKTLLPALMTYIKRAASEKMVGLVLETAIDAAVENKKTPQNSHIAARAKKILKLREEA